MACPGSLATTPQYAHMCNVRFVVPGYACCDGGDCFKTIAAHGTFEAAKSCLRWKRRHGGALVPPPAVVLFWYLDAGDARARLEVAGTGNDTYYGNVWSQLAPALHGLPAVNLAIFAGTEDRFDLPADFADLPSVLPNLTAIPVLNAFLAYTLLEAADVVVASGRALANLGPLVPDSALLLRPRSRGAAEGATAEDVLEKGTEAAEDDDAGAWFADGLTLHPNGTLVDGTATLAQRLHDHLCARPQRATGLHLVCTPT